MTEGAVANVSKLPPKVWIIVGVGTVGFFFFTKSRTAATATGTATDPTADPTLNGSADGGMGGSGVGTGPGGWVSGTEPLPTEQGTTGTVTPATNEEWAYKAEQDLIARGYSPTLVDTALRDYITGSQLSTAEWAVISIALSLEGPPPEQIGGNVGTPPVRVPPTTAPPPPTQAPHPKPPAPKPPVSRPAPRPTRYYVVRRGDTLSSIATHYYGHASLWLKIYNANRRIIKDPNHIQVGWKLVIPY